MNQLQIARLGKILTNKKEEIEAEVAVLKQDLSAMPYQLADPNDQASQASERQLILMRIQGLSQSLKEVNQTLGRLHGGEYGICEMCEEDINEARLIARPSARYCVFCQEKLETRTSFAA